MSDEQKALVARLRSFVERHGHNDMAVTTLDTDDARAILAHIDAQAAEIEKLRTAIESAITIANLVRTGPDLAVPAYSRGRIDTANAILAALAQETQP